jgi:UDP-N-acetylglucosamine 4,6-dehydratase/5-epimerase
MAENQNKIYSRVVMKSRRFHIGDVRYGERLSLAMSGCRYVLHPAALICAPKLQFNQMECLKINVNSAENVVRSFIENNVHRVIALSIYNACNPFSLYGAAKLASEKIFVAANKTVGGKRATRFSVVRYSNVVGSSGFIIPFFRKIATKESVLPIKVPKITQFWITQNTGVELVFKSFDVMDGGEIFVPRIPSVNTMMPANVVGKGLGTNILGIRPAEKLRDMMILEDNAWRVVDLGYCYAVQRSITGYKRRSFVEKSGASKVDDRFSNSNEINKQKLREASFKKLLIAANV